MNVVDWLMIIILLMAVLNGFRQGIINSVVTFIGMLLVFVLAFYLKNPVSTLLYEHLPFFSLKGSLTGITILNVLIYEGISYLITIIILATLLKIISKVSGAVNSLVNSTIILGLPSKLLGAVVGLLEGYIIVFVIVFIFSLIGGTAEKVQESRFAPVVLDKTPVLSLVVADTYNSVKEVYEIVVENKNSTNKDNANLQSLDVLLKYEILSVSSADKLIQKDKITIPGADTVIDKYRKD